MSVCRDTPDGALLAVRVVPRARKSSIDGIRDGALVIRLNAPPVEGAANDALVELLSGRLHLPRRAITLAHGEHSRTKRVLIAGIPAEQVLASLVSA